jgi:hypothetical protein
MAGGRRQQARRGRKGDGTVSDDRDYLVWSHEHGAWWRPDRVGYTVEFREAGLYTRDEALAICANALGGWREGLPFNEVPVRFEDVQAAWWNRDT